MVQFAIIIPGLRMSKLNNLSTYQPTNYAEVDKNGSKEKQTQQRLAYLEDNFFITPYFMPIEIDVYKYNPIKNLVKNKIYIRLVAYDAPYVDDFYYEIKTKWGEAHAGSQYTHEIRYLLGLTKKQALTIDIAQKCPEAFRYYMFKTLWGDSPKSTLIDSLFQPLLPLNSSIINRADITLAKSCSSLVKQAYNAYKTVKEKQAHQEIFELEQLMGHLNELSKSFYSVNTLPIPIKKATLHQVDKLPLPNACQPENIYFSKQKVEGDKAPFKVTFSYVASGMDDVGKITLHMEDPNCFTETDLEAIDWYGPQCYGRTFLYLSESHYQKALSSRDQKLNEIKHELIALEQLAKLFSQHENSMMRHIGFGIMLMAVGFIIMVPMIVFIPALSSFFAPMVQMLSLQGLHGLVATLGATFGFATESAAVNAGILMLTSAAATTLAAVGFGVWWMAPSHRLAKETTKVANDFRVKYHLADKKQSLWYRDGVKSFDNVLFENTIYKKT